MPIMVHSISYSEAMQAVNAVVQYAAADGGEPVAVAVVDASSRLICFAAMDGVMPASIRLSQSKAYSAVVGRRDTEVWSKLPKNSSGLDFDMRNWTDEDFTGFTGGVIVRHGQEVIGGIGVSGRKGAMCPEDARLQDTELAELGRKALSTTAS